MWYPGGECNQRGGQNYFDLIEGVGGLFVPTVIRKVEKSEYFSLVGGCNIQVECVFTKVERWSGAEYFPSDGGSILEGLTSYWLKRGGREVVRSRVCWRCYILVVHVIGEIEREVSILTLLRVKLEGV